MVQHFAPLCSCLKGQGRRASAFLQVCSSTHFPKPWLKQWTDHFCSFNFTVLTHPFRACLLKVQVSWSRRLFKNTYLSLVTFSTWFLKVLLCTFPNPPNFSILQLYQSNKGSEENFVSLKFSATAQWINVSGGSPTTIINFISTHVLQCTLLNSHILMSLKWRMKLQGGQTGNINLEIIS